MRKFLLPVINLINLIFVAIVFGLTANTAVLDIQHGQEIASGNYYELVWKGSMSGANALGIVGFFVFIVAVVLVLAQFVPFKGRKIVSIFTTILLIEAGVLFLLTPAHAHSYVQMQLTGSLIASAVLLFVAGALTCLMCVLEFTEKKAK